MSKATYFVKSKAKTYVVEETIPTVREIVEEDSFIVTFNCAPRLMAAFLNEASKRWRERGHMKCKTYEQITIDNISRL